MFWKNILFTIPLYWYAFFSGFGGSLFYEDYLLQFYNLVFTSWPIMWFATIDKQHEREELLAKPLLYLIGLRNSCLNNRLFLYESFQAVVLALLITVVTFQCIVGDYWLAGTLIYSIIVLIATLKVTQKMNNHTWISTAFLVGSVLSFWLAVYIESKFPSIEAMFGIF